MKLLAEISEGTLGLADEFAVLGDSYRLRKSARAIVLNERGEMATQYLNTYTYHKLPGGGVDEGETVEEALYREVKEEVGCACEIVAPIGIVIEYRNKYKMLHISYGYAANGAAAIARTTKIRLTCQKSSLRTLNVTKLLP
jgi:8-oxo-dGTP diphosphatase